MSPAPEGTCTVSQNVPSGLTVSIEQYAYLLLRVGLNVGWMSLQTEFDSNNTDFMFNKRYWLYACIHTLRIVGRIYHRNFAPRLYLLWGASNHFHFVHFGSGRLDWHLGLARDESRPSPTPIPHTQGSASEERERESAERSRMNTQVRGRKIFPIFAFISNQRTFK